MKKFLTLFFILFCMPAVIAEENMRPEQNFNDNRAVVSVQKQPAYDGLQKQGIKNNWFCIIIQINGKVLETLPETGNEGG